MKKLLCVILAAVTALTAVSCAGRHSSGNGKSHTAVRDLTVHFIDVEQGDSTLLESGGEFVLIDSGELEYSQRVLDCIGSLGAEKLKYVIVTHPHYDHYGGMSDIISDIKTENFITVETDCDTASWTKLLKTVDRLDINYIDAEVGNTYSCGSSTFTVMSPISSSYEGGYNEYSIAVKAVCGDISFMLTGDAERLNEFEMLDNGADVSADVLKCGHHGSSSSTSTRFLQAVDPVFAVISCAADNDYGHPNREVTERLALLGCKYFTTAQQGTIVARTDGHTLKIAPKNELNPSTYTAGSVKNPDSQLYYIGNKNSMYFHDPTCEGTKTMKSKNKTILNTREQAIAEGYSPCTRCEP